MVHQELSFCENLSVAENLCLGRLPATRGLCLEARDASTRARRCWRRSTSRSTSRGRRIADDRPAADAADRRRRSGRGARLIVFDEPTSSLSQHEAERLYSIIGRLRERGVTCIYVSHRLEEIFRLCDTVTVLRDGRHVATRPVAESTERRSSR